MQTDAPLGVSAPAAPAVARPRAGIAGRSTGSLLLSGGLALLAFVWLLPIVWIVLMALKPEPEIIRLPIRWLPDQPTLNNFGAALTTARSANIAVAFLNSIIVAILETVLTLAVDAMAAYALARLAFRGRT